MNEDERIRIIRTAEELFNTKGYRSTTIAELAERLRISKKTIYVHFSGKEAIATTLVEERLAAISAVVGDIRLGGDIRGEISRTIDRIKHEVIRVRPIFMDDIQTSLPHLWQRIVDFRGEKIVSFMQKAIETAQASDQARPIDARLATLLYVESIQTIMRPEFFTKHDFSMTEVIDTLTGIFTHGIFVANGE
jgi:AcrR family transcriptional regulator